jgi:hypothetical protein
MAYGLITLRTHVEPRDGEESSASIKDVLDGVVIRCGYIEVYVAAGIESGGRETGADRS